MSSPINDPLWSLYTNFQGREKYLLNKKASELSLVSLTVVLEVMNGIPPVSEPKTSFLSRCGVVKELSHCQKEKQKCEEYKAEFVRQIEVLKAEQTGCPISTIGENSIKRSEKDLDRTKNEEKKRDEELNRSWEKSFGEPFSTYKFSNGAEGPVKWYTGPGQWEYREPNYSYTSSGDKWYR